MVARAAPFPAPVKPRMAPAETVLADAAAGPVPRAHELPQAAPPAPAPVKPAQPAPAGSVPIDRAPEGDPAIRTAVAEMPAVPRAEAGDGSMHATTATGTAPAPAPAQPTADTNETAVALETTALAGRPIPQPLPKPVADAAGIEVAGGLVAVHAASGRGRAAALGSVPFEPQSAMLTSDAVARLTQFLADAEVPDARIEIVGEAPAPALALDRALAVGLALVQSGVPANRLELTLARGGSGDQARLFLAAPAL
jgi:outer membrane protein OmpA-like peptidoglycan-associated protein